MNWENQLSSILSVTDGSIAKMRERLTPLGKFSKEDDDLFPVRQSALGSDLDPPALSPRIHPHSQSSLALGSAVQWADLASVQSQLQIQSQAIEALTQKLHDLEREKRSQQCHIQTLQDEVQSLHEELRKGQSPGLEQRMEQWRREVGRELSSLRGHVKQATSLGNLEKSVSIQLCREELEHLQRELDQLKTQLRRQEEDTYLQQAEARETRRQYERSCKTLSELTDSYKTHSSDLLKTLSQYSHTQQEMQQIRSEVSELKDEMRSLGLQGHKQTHLPSAHTSGPSPPPAVPHIQKTSVRAEEADSDSEDFSPTPSLAEISSDDLSWLDDKDPAPQPRARLSIRSRPSDFTGPDSDVESHHDNRDEDDYLLDDDDDDDDNPELGSDLSLNDL
nr:general vesicular transport factor p115 [Nothobranchius furzeri]